MNRGKCFDQKYMRRPSTTDRKNIPRHLSFSVQVWMVRGEGVGPKKNMHKTIFFGATVRQTAVLCLVPWSSNTNTPQPGENTPSI